MPEIIVSAGPQPDAPVLLRERVSESALASEHYSAQLIERIGWAVVDASATEVERSDGPLRRVPAGRA